MEIGNIIAHNVKRLREERNLSQGQLADAAGVSKVVISQIEKGDSNPTVNTIWKLAKALGLPYTSLLEMENVEAEHIKRADVAEITEDKYHIFSYYPKNSDRNFEIYRIVMEAGCDHPSVGHSKKSFEYIMLTKGDITVISGGKSYVLSDGDALYFDGTLPHTYINSGSDGAEMTMVIQYV